MSTRTTSMALALFLVLIVSADSVAQPTAGAIAGDVKDDEGHVISGATVRLEGTAQGAKSRHDGTFFIAGVRAGEYQLRVTTVGFTPWVCTVQVAAGQTLNIHPKLSAKPIDVSGVVVSAKADYIRPERSSSTRSIRMNDDGGGYSSSSSTASTSGTSAPSSYSSGTNAPPSHTPATAPGTSAVRSGVGAEYGNVSNGSVNTGPTGVNGFSINGGTTSVRVDNVDVGDPFSRRSDDANSDPENPFLAADTAQLSTFSIDVDAGAYSMMRRAIAEGRHPARDAVRIEEMINYFPYDYPEPDAAHPFSITTDVATCPWNSQHLLVRIGLQGRRGMAETPASNLVFLIDVSGSMMPAERLPLIKQGFRKLVERLREQDTVAIVVYAGAAGLVLPPTSGLYKSTILQAIDNLRAGGSTAGGKGIQLAYDVAGKLYRAGANNRVILATDGDFNVGTTDTKDLVKLIESKRDAGIFLTTIGVGSRGYRDRLLEQLADHGNGAYAYLDNFNEAVKVFETELTATLFTIAKDVKVQVEFNPVTVESYRLIGYENRMLATEDFENDRKDAGELGAGHSVTALYEVAVQPAAMRRQIAPRFSDASMRYHTSRIAVDPALASELFDVRLRYKEPHGEASRLVEHPVGSSITSFENAPTDLRFAAAVAEFGLILRNSKHRGAASLEHVITTARDAQGNDPYGYRAEFITLTERLRAMSTQQK